MFRYSETDAHIERASSLHDLIIEELVKPELQEWTITALGLTTALGYTIKNSFLLFLFYVFFGAILGLVVVSFSLLHGITDRGTIFLSAFNVVICVIGIFLAILFAIFTAIMFGDQISCITSDISTIDKLKNTKIKK